MSTTNSKKVYIQQWNAVIDPLRNLIFDTAAEDTEEVNELLYTVAKATSKLVDLAANNVYKEVNVTLKNFNLYVVNAIDRQVIATLLVENREVIVDSEGILKAYNEEDDRYYTVALTTQ